MDVRFSERLAHSYLLVLIGVMLTISTSAQQISVELGANVLQYQNASIYGQESDGYGWSAAFNVSRIHGAKWLDYLSIGISSERTIFSLSDHESASSIIIQSGLNYSNVYIDAMPLRLSIADVVLLEGGIRTQYTYDLMADGEMLAWSIENPSDSSIIDMESKYFQNFGFSIVTNASIEIPMGQGAYFAPAIGYRFGLTSILQDHLNIQTKQNAISISIGIVYDLSPHYKVGSLLY